MALAKEIPAKFPEEDRKISSLVLACSWDEGDWSGELHSRASVSV